MSERLKGSVEAAIKIATRDTSKSLLKSTVKVVSLGFAAGMVGVAGVTVRHHREQTHRSLRLSEHLQKAIDLEQRSLGVEEPYTWASVHRVHHQMEDANLVPFRRIYHAVNEARARGIAVPDSFKHLDPFVDKFDLETVMKIGRSADKLVKERLGDLYKKPRFENDAQIVDTLNPTEPQYHYPEGEEYTADKLAGVLLRDPHSPALMKRNNGVKGIAFSNVNLYKSVADAFRSFPSVKPLDLQRPEDFEPNEDAEKRKRRAVIGGFAIPMAAMLIWNRDFTAKGIGKAVVEGAAINGIRAATEIFGGNVTNSAGHMGDPVQMEIAQALLNQRYEIKLKPDGTISTNTVGKGIAGRAASWATLDEVGGQEIHHKKPWKIAYTDAEGRKALIEAPWGSFLEYLADTKKVSFIKRGDNFNGQPRPDVVHEAVKWIQEARARQLAATI